MKTFQYKAFEQSGAKNNGFIEASDELKALEILKSQGLLVVSIEEPQKKLGLSLFKQKVSLADVEFLTSELSLLLASGVKIDKGLDIIKRSKSNPALAVLLSELSKSLKSGMSLSEAFRQQSDTFDELYCSLIALGEASGNLSQVFHDLSLDLKFKRQLQQKIISSLTYPLVIFCVCILSVFFIFNVIIPRMAVMFKDADSIPWYTELMLNTSDWMTNYQWFLISGVVLSGAVIWKFRKSPQFQLWWQRKAIKLPLIRKAVLLIESIRFNSGLTMMIKADVPIDKALALSCNNIKNLEIRRELEIARNNIKKGHVLSSVLRQTSIYPEFYISLLEVGEESGKLDVVFDEITNRSRTEFETWTQRVTSLIEPLMILIMGGLVGGVVVIMLLSMVSINDIGV